MSPSHPTRLHYHLARKLEDWYAQSADAMIYVSRRNMERVRDRQPPAHREKFHLIRRGAKRLPAPETPPADRSDFRITYTGGTGGWYALREEERPPSLAKRAYRAWENLGTHSLTELDYTTHGPIYVGRAVKRLLEQHPDWAGRVHIDVYGPRYPQSVVTRVLEKFELEEIVHLHGRVPHEEALQHMTESDLLFMALPDRVDGSPGGRISAKTYEYLLTDRPILAALPPGENREYLEGNPGVSLVPPDGIDHMTRVIGEYASATFSGESIAVDRSALHPKLSSTARAEAFENVLAGVVGTSTRPHTPQPVLHGHG